MTTLIRAESPQDLLALVPHLAGFHPVRSLVCVAFQGRRTAGALRHDLPRTTRQHGALVDVVTGTICRMPGVDGVVPIVYTERPFPHAPHASERRLLRLMSERLNAAGFAVRDCLVVAATGWGSLHDRDLPPGGRPLDELAGDGLDLDGLLDDLPAPDQRGYAALPEPSPVLAAQIAERWEELSRFVEELDEVWAGDPDGDDPDIDGRLDERFEPGGFDEAWPEYLPQPGILRRLGALADPVDFMEAVLDDPGAASEPDRLAFLLWLCRQGITRVALMLQAGFGEDVGDLALTDLSFEGHELLSGLLLGRVERRPDPGRVVDAIRVLGTAIANSPGDGRAGALAAAAWLSWALGRGSAAGVFAGAALDADPSVGTADIVLALVDRGMLPLWAFAAPTGPLERISVR